MESPSDRLRKQLQLDDSWHPIQPRVLGADMPLSQRVLDHPWPGNFRDLEAYARKLRADQGGVIARWPLALADRALEAIPPVEATVSAAGAEDPDDVRPQRLLALAFFHAVTHPRATQASISRQMIVHLTPLREMLKHVSGRQGRSGPSTRRAQAYLEHLTERERTQLRDAANRVLDNSRQRGTS